MQQLEKTVKSYLGSAMVSSALMLMLGIILLIFPEDALAFIRYGFSILLMLIGVFMVARELTRRTIFPMFTGSTTGVLLFVLGIILLIYPNILNIIPIVLGVWIIVSSTFSLRLSASVRQKSLGAFIFSVLTSIISIVCGAILIINPTDSTVALTALVGIMVIIHAISSLLELIIFRSNLQAVSKYLKNSTK